MTTLDPVRKSPSEPSLLRLRSGIDWNAEDEANQLLAADRRSGQGDDEYLVLSTDQMTMRQNREVINSLGVCDPSLRQGMYRKAYNPLLGQRPRGQHKTEDA